MHRIDFRFLKRLFPYLVALVVLQVILCLVIDPIAPDSKLYLTIGLNVLSHSSFSVDGENPTRCVPPLYVLFLVIFYHSLGQSAAVVSAVQIMLNLIGFLLLIRTAELVYGSDGLPELLPAILVCDIVIWVFSAYILSETLYILLCICCVYFVIKGSKSGNPTQFAAGGLFAGLSLMTRPSGIGLIASFIPLAWLGAATARDLLFAGLSSSSLRPQLAHRG